jgi:hypothetical protein
VPDTWNTKQLVQHGATVIKRDAQYLCRLATELQLLGLQFMVVFPSSHEFLENFSRFNSDDRAGFKSGFVSKILPVFHAQYTSLDAKD